MMFTPGPLVAALAISCTGLALEPVQHWTISALTSAAIRPRVRHQKRRISCITHLARALQTKPKAICHLG